MHLNFIWCALVIITLSDGFDIGLVVAVLPRLMTIVHAVVLIVGTSLDVGTVVVPVWVNGEALLLLLRLIWIG